jgi:hypothetical protein
MESSGTKALSLLCVFVSYLCHFATFFLRRHLERVVEKLRSWKKKWQMIVFGFRLA